MTPQSAILEAIPDHARHLFFELRPGTHARPALKQLAAACDGRSALLGIGAPVAAAIAQGQGAGLDSSSFAAVQQWRHDFSAFDAMPCAEQDDCFGRDRDSNEELEVAPTSAHVRRTAQENFDPPAFVVRRSMAWTQGADAGLVFLTLGKSFDADEALLRRMTGHDDGISDALFSFTRPLTGGYYWCPPMQGGKVDLSALGS